MVLYAVLLQTVCQPQLLHHLLKHHTAAVLHTAPAPAHTVVSNRMCNDDHQYIRRRVIKHVLHSSDTYSLATLCVNVMLALRLHTNAAVRPVTLLLLLLLP
jgi:hypothetical protein